MPVGWDSLKTNLDPCILIGALSNSDLLYLEIVITESRQVEVALSKDTVGFVTGNCEIRLNSNMTTLGPFNK